MKNNKDRKSNHFYNDYDEEEMKPSKKKDEPRRRPVRNWKKVWTEHQSDYDEYQDLFKR